MLTRNAKRNLSLLIAVILATIVLTGCFKAEVSIEVKPNGSGILGLAFGVTQQAKALLARDGEDPSQTIMKSLGNGNDVPKDVTVSSWIDGDYEWTKAEKEFANLDEINSVLETNAMFKEFSVTQSHGLLRDIYFLDAELTPMNSNILGNDLANDSKIDASSFIQISFSARLPGKIIETNGIRDVNDASRIVWSAANEKAVSIHARSIAWNWISILAILGSVLMLGSMVVGSIGYVFYARSQKNKKMNKAEQSMSVPIPATNVPAINFDDRGIEKLFVDINEKVLNQEAQVRKGSGEIALVWRNKLNHERLIEIRAFEGNQIWINGQVYPANKKDVRAGILDTLRKEVKK